jgi:hypothetical protein
MTHSFNGVSDISGERGVLSRVEPRVAMNLSETAE